MKRRFCLTVLTLFVGLTAFAQLNKEPNLTFPQARYPQGLDYHKDVLFYYNGSKAYNIQGREMSNVKREIKDFKLNSAAISYAVLSVSKKGKSQVDLLFLNHDNEILHRFPEKEVGNATAIAFTPNARQILIVCGDKLRTYELSKYTLLKEDDLGQAPVSVCVSNNSYFLAGITGDKSVTIWNLETKAVRKAFQTSATVKDIAFSRDSRQFGILTADGVLAVYDTRSFQLQKSFDGLESATTFDIHPAGKHIAYNEGDNKITVFNSLEPEDRQSFTNTEGGISYLKFLSREKGGAFLAYNSFGNLNYKNANSLAPYYTRLMEDELQSRMNDWLQRMPGESLEAYNQRVNEDSRARKARDLEEEISTRLAETFAGFSAVTLGNYNSALQLLAIEFSTMPTIFLPVPEPEVSTFKDGEDLEFHNVRYGLTQNDKFEMVYADITNKATGKRYTYDNRERRSMGYLKDDENFVPLELIQQASMEEILLTQIKEKIVDAAKQENVITDHTHIAVNAHVINDFDADGKRIYNYEVGYNYEVEEEFSSRDDFPSGQYQVEKSAAAMSMLSIVKESLSENLSQYLRPGKKLKVQISGSADASPIRRTIPYQGVYGEYVNEPIYKNGELESISVTKANGISQNEQLAFLRALGVKKYIQENFEDVNKMKTEFTEHIEVAKERGSAFRRISVVLTFIDAF